MASVLIDELIDGSIYIFIPPSSQFLQRPESALFARLHRLYPLPNEDLGRMNKRGNPDFEGSTFQGRE